MNRRTIILGTNQGTLVDLNGTTTFNIPNARNLAKEAESKKRNVRIYVKTDGALETGMTNAPIDTTNVDLLEEFKVKREVEAVGPEAELMSFIHNSPNIKPDLLKLSDIKWKYLVRSAVRAKNIMMTGPAGCGKTMAAKALVEALDRPHFYFNLGATQDPRATLIGNTHFSKEEGTYFSKSAFVTAIQTKDSVILLDEISRAHPEAWNILMTVLDQGQRYLRLDEAEGAPTVEVAEGVSFIATANIGNEYTSTRVMDRAIMDRFTIIEMDPLSKDEEADLLQKMYPAVDMELIEKVSEIGYLTRSEVKKDTARISTSISTRLNVEITSLLQDGFTLPEAAEVAIYPFFSEDGGMDSERTFIKQIVQKFTGTEATEEELFGQEKEDETPAF
tara:strand:+ start:2246 stop:3415 length:1170 start_codon:yes stop_codon:yes gene_type:complete